MLPGLREGRESGGLSRRHCKGNPQPFAPMNRREFLTKTSLTAAGCATAGLLSKSFGADLAPTQPGGVAIICDPGDPVASARPARWAAEQLQQALAGRGFSVRMCARLDEAGPG